VFTARASINLNPRSYEKTAYRLLSKVAAQMENRDFYNTRKAYDSVCGTYQAEMDKRWLVDIDDPGKTEADRVGEYITSLQEDSYHPKPDDTGPRKVLAYIPSKNGWHIITEPFNLMEFSKRFKHEVHKNNPTNLYIP
jgi:hypothetical protein